MIALRLGFGVSGRLLAPTGLCVVAGGSDHTQLGDMEFEGDDMVDERLSDPDVYRYKIECAGTGITEYYEYKVQKSKDQVREEWLNDVGDSWGTGFKEAFEGSVEVTTLWETTQETSSSERSAIPMPPVPQEELEE